MARGLKKLRILLITNEDLVPPDDLEGCSPETIQLFKTDYHVVQACRSLGHEVYKLGVSSELAPVRDAIEEFKPHIAFNLVERFRDLAALDQNVVSYLELMRVPYTGCNPRGLMIARDKALSKKILHYHRIRVPRFVTVPQGRRVRLPKGLDYPLIVKSLLEESSTGISQASVVRNSESLEERVRFIHEKIDTAAIVEQYIDGREIYVGVLGNQRLEVLPVWELFFDDLPRDAPRIATSRIKFDLDFQHKHNIEQGPAEGLPPELVRHIESSSKRIYRLLSLSGYGRLDYRLTPDGRYFLLEANPNPDIARDEEFASAAISRGYTYESVIQKVLNLGRRWRTGAW
jgi:D-alanine-D-alanine ligase